MASNGTNVVWIFGDQHRGQALGYEGDPNVFTPNIDAMATEALLPQGVSGCPLCCPYRGALLTSRYPHESVPDQEDPLPADMRTVAHAFNEAGYDTAWFGKWHVGGIKEREGRAAFATVPRTLRGGFDTWIGYDNNNSQFDSWVHGHDASGNEIAHYRLDGYETDALTDMLIDYIRAHGCHGAHGSESPSAGSRRPFFAALSVQPPHAPYAAPERFMANHNAGSIRFRPNVPDLEWVRAPAARELAGYYAMIENLDWNVGRVRSAIADAGLKEQTHIIFFSDHGDMHGSHGLFRKANPYEEAIRVPMMIAGTTPHYDVRRGRSDLLMNHVDVAPTSLGLAGISVPDWMDGTNYADARLPSAETRAPAGGAKTPAPRGGPQSQDDNEDAGPTRPSGSRPQSNRYPDSAYLQQVAPKRSPSGIDRPWRGVLTRDGWKYVCLEHQPWLMFNLNDDPYEQVNLAHNLRYAAERKRLHDRLRQWIADTRDGFLLE